MSLVQLTDMTSFSIPVDVAHNQWPPKMLIDNMGFGHIEGFMTPLQNLHSLKTSKSLIYLADQPL
jgi:hypothetical protein